MKEEEEALNFWMEDMNRKMALLFIVGRVAQSV
jgi:hypothetical protein